MRRASSPPTIRASRRPRPSRASVWQQRLGDRRQRLDERLLNEDDPVGSGRDGVGGQHRVAVETSRDLGRRRARAPPSTSARLRGSVGGESRLDLRELREIGVAQHQAEVGISDQLALVVDHEGVALFADANGADHVPDQFEIDVGDGHPGLTADMGHRDGHVGLGAAAKFDRTEPDLVGDGSR